MTHKALGTVCTFILLNCIKGRQDAGLSSFEKMEVLAGQDVALHCAIDNSSTRIIMIEWSKNGQKNEKLALYSPTEGEKLFSPNVTLVVNNKTLASSLHLHNVTKFHSGIYICGLSTFPLGSIRKKIELNVTDVPAGTEKVFAESTDSILPTSLANQHSAAVTRTTAVPTDATDGPNTSRGLLTAGTNATSYTNDTQSRVTSAPATSPDLFSPSNHQGMRTSLNASPDQAASSDATTRPADSATISTWGTRDNALQRTRQPEVTPSTVGQGRYSTSLEESSTLGSVTDHLGNTLAPTAGSTGVSIINEDGTQEHLMLLSTMVPVFLVVAAILGWRWIRKRRMDLPPPFKPPPPPVKYTSARYREPSADMFFPPI